MCTLTSACPRGSSCHYTLASGIPVVYVVGATVFDFGFLFVVGVLLDNRVAAIASNTVGIYKLAS